VRCGQWIEVALIASLATGCASPASTQTQGGGTATDSPSGLAEIRGYLVERVDLLTAAVGELQAASDTYYTLAEVAAFDYPALWESRSPEVRGALQAARESWMEASPAYEKIEGIVAGVPSLAHFDIILDAGTSLEEGGENVVPFDLELPDGRLLRQPGNLFGVSESALWGTWPAFVAVAEADWDANGVIEFGESLPDAAVLKAAVDAMVAAVADLQSASQVWRPTESDAFTALVVMVPTMNEYFDSWKSSRFVAGEASTQRDFVAISRLADILDILSGLQVVYAGVSPRVEALDGQLAEQIAADLSDLRDFVSDVYQRERAGHQFTAEEAELLGNEAQDRATAVTGQLAQAAAQLGVPIQD
jgi:hypothetical protein